MKKIKVQDGQSIYDIAVQIYGSVQKVSTLLNDNKNLINLDTNLVSGTELSYTENNEAIPQAFRLNDVIINTSDPKTATGGDYNDDYNNDYNV